MMNPTLQQDLQNLSEILEQAKQFSLQYLNKLDDTPPGKILEPLNAISLPEVGLGAIQTQDFFKDYFLHQVVVSSGSRYFGYVTGGTTTAAIVGDWLTSIFDQNTQSISGLGDISAWLELETIKMLLSLFELPDAFNGGMVSGATMSNFTCLAVARQWVGHLFKRDIAREGNIAGMRIYTAVPHSSSLKSLAMLGLGSNNVILVPTLPSRESMDIDQLKKQLNQHPTEPFILIASAGTVYTVDFDDLQAIAELKKEYTFWWHIDAAFGAFAACSPNYQHLLKGWELADSLTIDCHKWLNYPMIVPCSLPEKSMRCYKHKLSRIQTLLI